MISFTIGKVTYDTTIPLEEYPVENSRTISNEKYEGVGGSAAIVASFLAKWGVDSYINSTVGYDDFGTKAKKELDDARVHTTYLETNFEKKTSTTMILNSKKTTSRTEFMVEPEVYHIKKYEYQETPDLIYSDGYEYSATLAVYALYPNAIKVLGAGMKQSDPKEVEALAKASQYVIFSLDYIERYFGYKVDFANPNTLLDMYKMLSEKFLKSINIVTLHDKGVLYVVNNEVKVMPTIEVKAIDRTGAGDIFDGAFCYALTKGYDLEKALRIASIAAARSTTKYGGKESIPIISDVIMQYEEQFGSIDDGNDNPPTQAQGQTEAPQAPAEAQPQVTQQPQAPVQQQPQAQPQAQPATDPNASPYDTPDNVAPVANQDVSPYDTPM